MATFALVHGGAHDSWCWHLVADRLRRLGHQVTAPDLPIEDPLCGALEWARAISGAAEPADDLIVVAHSMAGMALPVVATLRPVRRMIFLSAVVPVPSSAYVDYLARYPNALTIPPETFHVDELGRNVTPPDVAEEYFYHDCPDDLARAACAHLRPTAMTVFTERCPLDRWPDVPASYILGTADRAVSPEWSRRISRELLGAQAIELGTGHSSFLADPDGLVGALLRASRF